MLAAGGTPTEAAIIANFAAGVEVGKPGAATVSAGGSASRRTTRSSDALTAPGMRTASDRYQASSRVFESGPVAQLVRAEDS